MPDGPEMIAGRYEVLRHLGTGGMGTVVLARDQVLQREVAIKRVHAGAGTDAARRIEREAKMGASLTHPGLVTILDTVVDGPNLLIVMEHVSGETLADRLGRGRLAPDQTLDVLRPLASAIDHAHAHGIVHRDVKPANVLLGERGTVKLADLGVALAEDVSRITRENSVIGSLPYMAPEQLEPGRTTPAADVYALAAIAYEALSGRRTRTGTSPMELAREASSGRVPDLREVAPDLPAAAASALAAGMAIDPGRRPASASDLVDRLATALAPAPAPTAQTAVPRPAAPRPAAGRQRRPAPLLAALAMALVLAALLVVVLAGGAEDPAPSRATSPDPTATSARDETTTAAPEESAEPADASTPAGAVRRFYESAAAGDLDAAWALAGPQMKAAFGSRTTFDGDLGTLESIRFKTLTEGTAGPDGTPVSVETVARHTTRTDRCSGELLAVPDGAGGYLVDPAGVSCDSS